MRMFRRIVQDCEGKGVGQEKWSGAEIMTPKGLPSPNGVVAKPGYKEELSCVNNAIFCANNRFSRRMTA